MKKKKQLVFFVLFVAVGIILINTSLSGLSWFCRCLDDYNTSKACNQLCKDHGGCLYWYFNWSECVCMGGDNECTCVVRLECEDGAHGWYWSRVKYCWDCES